MATVYIPFQMRELTNGAERVEVSGDNLRQVIRALGDLYPELAARLSDGDRLTPGLAASIDGAFANRGLLAKVNPTSEVHFMPAIGGG